MNKHLLSLHDLTPDDIVRVLDTAESFREVGTRVIKKVPALRGRTVVNLFYENSTRTQDLVRARGEAAVGRRDQLLDRRIQRVEGREPQGHGAHAAGDGGRRGRDPSLVLAEPRTRSRNGSRAAC